jgi:sugar phosphate isomerase/epimerase
VALRDTGYDGVISIELEDVPGVSRGASPVPGVVKDKRSATEDFDRENVLAMEYLKGTCAQQDIPVD